MTFAGIEGGVSTCADRSSQLHRLVWTPALPSVTPYKFGHIIFLTNKGNELVMSYQSQLEAKGYSTCITDDPDQIRCIQQETIVVQVPRQAKSKDDLFGAISESCSILFTAAKVLSSMASPLKLSSVIARGDDVSDLGHAPLYGLYRIIYSQYPEIWGSLFEEEDGTFPLPAIRYIQGMDIVRMDDGIPRTACLRSLYTRPTKIPITFCPGGTYLITGGLGALGLEIASWMVKRGARRSLLLSRQKLPHRSTWSSHEKSSAVQKIMSMEDAGATIIPISLDISEAGVASDLAEAIAECNIPPVTGVVHAAGVLKDQLVKEITTESFDAVLAPKIKGALNLDKLFLPGSLEFFTMFSSCGQLFGFPGKLHMQAQMPSWTA